MLEGLQYTHNKVEPKPNELRAWLQNEHPQYVHILDADFAAETSISNLLVLTAAAGLKRLVAFLLEQDKRRVRASSTWMLSPPPALLPALLTMVATGKRLSTSSASRELMINLLSKQGVGVDQSTPAIDLLDTLIRRTKFRGSRTALAWVLRHEPQKYISNEERYSIAGLLLENRADPNTFAVPDTCCPEGTSLLQSCIRHYDVEAVRLLLLHEAEATYLDEPMSSFQFEFMEALRGETTMTSLLGEYGIGTRMWGHETLNSVEKLVGKSVSLIGIGNSHIAKIIGQFYQEHIFLVLPGQIPRGGRI